MIAKAAPEDAGDIWTWVALDADTKLVPSWRVGDRSGATAIEFVCDLSHRLANRVQVTSDGHRAYLEAVEAGFGANDLPNGLSWSIWRVSRREPNDHFREGFRMPARRRRWSR